MGTVIEAGKVAADVTNWSAISAVVTGVAALVALLVGVLPLVLASRRRKRQAAVLGQVLADNLSIQELHVRAAMQVPKTSNGLVTAWEYQQMSKATAFLDPRPVMDLISFSPNLPRYVVSAVARCAAMLDIARQRRVFLAEPVPGETYSVAGDIGWYESVAADLLGLRSALHRWLGSEPQEFSAAATELADNLREVALADERDCRLAQARESAREAPSRE